MRPDVSLIPAPNRSTEKRVPLTPKQRAQLALDQNGRCGCGCGERLDHALGPGHSLRRRRERRIRGVDLDRMDQRLAVEPQHRALLALRCKA